ncbi:MAG: SUMF1/EgtB/PvdO family nonheme iron enzyme [Candidatus Cloacimonadaceae bacterium]|jgi:formylglycine-generating enzyme required for sulfatase activity|nr:SUMF1/EgtB/PvdO family nonheme iron enzyme [Candidatus Cloacimonadaceae bacterium]
MPKNPEATTMQYCLNCGEKIPEKAKFCPFCGENVVLDELHKPAVEKEAAQETKPKAVSPEAINKNFTLLDPGEHFEGYKILRMMNKDKEGIKYIAEKNGKEHVLKIFFKSSFHNMDSLFGIQMRLNRLNHIQDAHIAKVTEVNQNHSPAFMAVEYVHGVSLDEIKQYNPERLTEELVREIALKLIKTVMQVRKHGLSISDLQLSSIMIKDNSEPVILSSGIGYNEEDEREDIFIIGTIIAQLLATNPLYRSIYNPDRLRLNKFTKIVGVTMALNKVLAESLHRNVSQRFGSLDKFYTAIDKLGPVEGAEICTVQDTSFLDPDKKQEDIMPKSRIEIGFWVLIGAVVVLMILLFTTNIYKLVFGVERGKLQFTGLVWGKDSVEDSLAQRIEDAQGKVSSSEPVLTTYGQLKGSTLDERQDPRRLPAVPQSKDASSAPVIKPSQPGRNFVRIEPSTFGFGRLGENLAHNVSISGFYISKYEVTQGEWSRFMKPANATNFGEDLPVDNVSWFDIAIYCNGLSEAEGLTPAYRIRGLGASRVVSCDFNVNGYRLPTEAEWEVAAKAGKLYNYSGSNDPADVAWYRDNSAGKLRKPGGKSPNDFGIYDMSGNVSEWVWDWLDANYPNSLTTFINPTGPETGTQKTIRGGNVMNSEGRNLNILWRERGDPNKGYQFVGFRLARSK